MMEPQDLWATVIVEDKAKTPPPIPLPLPHMDYACMEGIASAMEEAVFFFWK